jgi:hypothetical protein
MPTYSSSARRSFGKAISRIDLIRSSSAARPRPLTLCPSRVVDGKPMKVFLGLRLTSR